MTAGRQGSPASPERERVVQAPQQQWNLSIKDTLNKGHLSTEDTVCSPYHIELCTNLPLNWEHLSIQDSQLGPDAVLYREVPLYTGQPAGS